MDEQEGAARTAGAEGERDAEPEPGAEEAFDADPPVDPSEPQVGNSRARFFVPREDADEGDGESEEGDEAESEGGDSG